MFNSLGLWGVSQVIYFLSKQLSLGGLQSDPSFPVRLENLRQLVQVLLQAVVVEQDIIQVGLQPTGPQRVQNSLNET